MYVEKKGKRNDKCSKIVYNGTNEELRMNGTKHKFSIFKNDEGLYKIKFETHHYERWLRDTDTMGMIACSHRSSEIIVSSEKEAERQIAKYYSYWREVELMEELRSGISSLDRGPIPTDTWKKVKDDR